MDWFVYTLELIDIGNFFFNIISSKMDVSYFPLDYPNTPNFTSSIVVIKQEFNSNILYNMTGISF
jgi:hypothetical protein